MVDGLNDHRIADIGEFFADGFRWMGNTGCGTKNNLKEFQDNWQKPFQAAFSDKVCIDEARLYMGEWGAAFGRQEANHTGEFMGIAPTGKRVQIRYMDFWKVEGGGRQDRGQLRLRRLPPRDGAARQGRLRGPRLGSVRPRGARAARTQD